MQAVQHGGTTFNNCKFCRHCIYVFCIYLRTNSDLCNLQHKLIVCFSSLKVYIVFGRSSVRIVSCRKSVSAVTSCVSYSQYLNSAVIISLQFCIYALSTFRHDVKLWSSKRHLHVTCGVFTDDVIWKLECVYMNQQDAQFSVIRLYYFIRCSTCFGLY